MSIFTGAGVAIVTPMKANGEVNYPKLEELLNYQIENGTDAIIICGTTGESSTLTHEEHLEAIRFTIEKVAGRIPVIAGTGSNCTETAIYLSQEAEKYGADGLLLVSPYYNKATQKGLIAHFTAIANSVKIPIILYNIQGRTGVNMTPETIAYLTKHVENIVAVKEASGNISQIAKVAQLCGDSCDIYSGNDDQIVPILSLGGKGVISVSSSQHAGLGSRTFTYAVDRDGARASGTVKGSHGSIWHKSKRRKLRWSEQLCMAVTAIWVR